MLRSSKRLKISSTGPSRKSFTQSRPSGSRTHQNIPSRAAPGPPGTALTPTIPLDVIRLLSNSHCGLSKSTARLVFIFFSSLCSCSPEWWHQKHKPCSQSEERAASQPEASLRRQRDTALPAQQRQPAEGERRQPAAAEPGLS